MRSEGEGVERSASGIDIPSTSASLENHGDRSKEGSVILRIKRKRGTDPISALRIDGLVSEGVDPRDAEQRVRDEDKDTTGISPDDPITRKRRPTGRGE